MKPNKRTRREALGVAGTLLAGTTARARASAAPQRPAPSNPRLPGGALQRERLLPPGYELANALEFEEQAKRVLTPEASASIAGSDREPFNRMTFRPRANRPGRNLDLSVTLFGETLFTPVMVGPIAEQRRYHGDAELATVQGAAAAHAPMVVSSRSSVPFAQIVARAYSPVWHCVEIDAGARDQARSAVAAGARVLFITVRSPARGTPGGARAAIDWRAIDAIRGELSVPIVLKGVMTPEEAATAVKEGYQGLVVSNYGALTGDGMVAPMDALGGIAAAVQGRVSVLIDGSFRRGSDVLKALILGAQGVLLGRPVAWGLAAYGADGVFWVIDRVQNELARSSVMVGAETVADLTRDHLSIHSRATE